MGGGEWRARAIHEQGAAKMKFEWDTDKDVGNVGKHGVSFEMARIIFKYYILSRVDDRVDYGETRYVGTGQIDVDTLVTVVYTERTGVVRLISARPASQRERRIYREARRKKEASGSADARTDRRRQG